MTIQVVVVIKIRYIPVILVYKSQFQHR